MSGEAWEIAEGNLVKLRRLNLSRSQARLHGPPCSLLQLKALTFVLKSPDYNNGGWLVLVVPVRGVSSGRM